VTYAAGNSDDRFALHFANVQQIITIRHVYRIIEIRYRLFSFEGRFFEFYKMHFRGDCNCPFRVLYTLLNHWLIVGVVARDCPICW